MRLNRSPVVFLIKSLMLDLLIVFAGLCAAFIRPPAGPLLGARCGLLSPAGSDH